ncbi:hypothetical protein [Ochrobactrum sp. RH2CCR150]|uniref:hypothetical protein n=1 Tax=Ochrobactrum sp. RH2CCR150 TaxID=2587044 RepID=UPI0015FB1DBE|nr:hypothetical protein [Ochrobactrum sp. RH2CCR150]
MRMAGHCYMGSCRPDETPHRKNLEQASSDRRKENLSDLNRLKKFQSFQAVAPPYFLPNTSAIADEPSISNADGRSIRSAWPEEELYE